MARPCSHCGGIKPKGFSTRQTCSDACATARMRATAGAASHFGARSASHRASVRKSKAARYKGGDKEEIILRRVAAQKGLCAVCGENGLPRGLILDHDHATGRPRFMLCCRCNVAVGMVKEDPAKAYSLLQYIVFWSGYKCV